MVPPGPNPTGTAILAAVTPEPSSSATPNKEAGNKPLTGGSLVTDLTEDQNGGQVALSVNDTVQVVLTGNISTGYTWETQNLDATLLEQQGELTVTSANKLAGSGSNFVFTFKALKTGVTHLRLIYHRPFEKNTPPERIYEVIVNIKE
jgi:inhibitor of cysteine peptidase